MMSDDEYEWPKPSSDYVFNNTRDFLFLEDHSRQTGHIKTATTTFDSTKSFYQECELFNFKLLLNDLCCITQLRCMDETAGKVVDEGTRQAL